MATRTTLRFGLIALCLWAAAPSADAQELPREVDWKGAPPGFLYFRHQLLPLMRSQCGQAACHGGFTGGRLHLAPPLETGEYSNQAALANYRSAISLVNSEDRLRSLLLLKPLRPDGYDFDRSLKGMDPVPHFGPRQVTHKARPNTPEREMFDALRDWVKGRRATNFAPIAFAGRDRLVPEGSAVVLDGTLSFDPNPEDQKRLKYEWKMLSRPEGSRTTLKAPTKPSPSFTADAPGTYIARLIVTDPKRRQSEPSYVVITAQGAQAKDDLAAFGARTTEKHELEAASAKLSGPAKLAPVKDEAGKQGIQVPAADKAAKTPGEATFDFDIKRPGKYGLWLLVRDRNTKEDDLRGPVAVFVDGKQQAVLPVPSDDKFWRLVQYGNTAPVKGSDEEGAAPANPMNVATVGPGGGVWTKTSGEWKEDADLKRLVSLGTKLINGRNVAEFGVECEGQMLISATMKALSLEQEDKPTKIHNGFIVFDYKSPFDFKIAGFEAPAQVPSQRFVIDWVGGPKGQNHLEFQQSDLELDRDYSVRLELLEDTAVLYYEGRKLLSHKFPKPFTGKIGVAALSSKSEFDNVLIWRNQQLVYANGFGDEPAMIEDPGGGDDPTKRLRRKKLLTFRLPEGKHSLKLQMFPGAPEIEKVVVARIDTVADVPPAARKTLRAVYYDLLGRGPTEEEMARDAAKAPAAVVKEIVSSYEFWNWFYEQELFHLDLTDTYRPTGSDEVREPARLEWEYNTFAADIHNRKQTLKSLYNMLVTGVYFHARNYGAEDYPSGLWQALYGRDIRDEPTVFEAAQAMYNGPEEPPPPVPGKAAKKPAPPKIWTIYGKTGKTREDLIAIALAQPAFAERTAARLYKRYVGVDAPDAQVKKDAALLAAGWNSGKEAIGDLIIGWLSSPAYLAKTSEYRRKSDAAFIRGLYVDIFNRPPEFGEFWGAYRIIRSLSDNEPMRAIVATMMVDSEEADFPLKSEIVRSEWIKEQIIKIYGRQPKGNEVEGLDDVLRRPQCGIRLLVRALVTHPEYQMY